MSWSQVFEKRVLDLAFGAVAWTAVGTHYLALFTAAPSDTGGGTEVTGGSYARVAVANNTTNWPAATGGSPASKSNGVAITFPAPTANWGIATHFGVFDAASGGNLIRWAALSTPKTINIGDPAPSFPIGALAFTEN